MRATILLIILVTVIAQSLAAEDRVMLASFEVLYESGMGMPRPREKKVVTTYRVSRSEKSRGIEVETLRGQKKQSRLICTWSAYHLLEVFEEVDFPKADYQKRIDEIEKQTPHRGVAGILMGNPGQKIRVVLHTKSGEVCFEAWEVDYLMYAHPDDPLIRAITQLVDACKIAVNGSDSIFLKD